MDINNEVHGERMKADTTTKPKYRRGLLPSHGGDRCGGIGECGEAAGGDSSSTFPSNLPLEAARSLSISVFLIFVSVHREIKYQRVYIVGFRSN
jgi:hypothetical protein